MRYMSIRSKEVLQSEFRFSRQEDSPPNRTKIAPIPHSQVLPFVQMELFDADLNLLLYSINIFFISFDLLLAVG
jgi:hypothetical protein